MEKETPDGSSGIPYGQRDGTNHFSIVYVRRTGMPPGSGYMVESSDDLGAWNPAAGSEKVAAIDPAWERVTFTLASEIATAEQAFLRVSVDLP